MLTKFLRLFTSCTVAMLAPSVFIVSVAQQQTIYSPSDVRDTLNRYCVTCHNDALKTANLMLDVADTAQLGNDTSTWEKVLRKLRTQQMPPAGMPRPDESTYNGLISYLEQGLDHNAVQNINPGRPDVHRLNRAEYTNAIRDLLSLEINGRDLLPADDIGYGFDNIADVLTVSPLLLERYLAAAAKISRLAIGDTSMPTAFHNYDLPRSLVQADWMGNELPFGSRGGMAVDHFFPVDGEYLIKVKLQTGRFDEILGLDRTHLYDIHLDGKSLGRFTVEGAERTDYRSHGADEIAADDHLEVIVPVKAGTRQVVASLVKDTIKVEGPPKVFFQGSIDNVEDAFFDGVGTLSIIGPYNVTGSGLTENRDKIFICKPSSAEEEPDCARSILSNLARHAYRRPVNEDDLTVLLALYNKGRGEGSFDNGIRLALQKILVSPEFLFRMEFEPAGIKPDEAFALTDLQLASRLSFFMWSSIPDEELLSVAEQGILTNPDILAQQVRRMLADPRSSQLVSNFAGQWLFLRNMDRVLPDPIAFPSFDDNLREALQKETELVIETMFREDLSVVELLNSDFTFVNERLARHYGIEGIYGTEFRRITVDDDRRKGLLGQGSILTVTSYPNRTSPTIRGKWVLEQLLGTPPPPPPPNVPTLKDDRSTKNLTMRERMEMHRANPACAACHKVMDPMGFALENFDGLGRWRDTTGILGSAPIDASGVLPDGTSFNGPIGLRDILLSQQDIFIETFTERLLTYALGRGVESYDFSAIRKIRRDAEADQHRWSAIINGIVNSVPFKMRRAISHDHPE